MTRVLLLVAAGLALVAAVAAAAAACVLRPTLGELEHEVLCPTCHTTLDVSQSPAADRIRAFLRTRIAAGDTKSQIKDRLVAQFGDGILAAPPRRGLGLLAWVVPIGAAALGAVGVAAGVAAARRAQLRTPANVPPVDPRLEALLDRELGRLEH